MPGPGGNGGELRNDDRFLKKVLQRGVKALDGISRTVSVEQLGALQLFDHHDLPVGRPVDRVQQAPGVFMQFGDDRGKSGGDLTEWPLPWA